MTGAYRHLGYFQNALKARGQTVNSYEDDAALLSEGQSLEERIVKPRPSFIAPTSASELLAYARSTENADATISAILDPMVDHMLRADDSDPYVTIKKPDIFARSNLTNDCALTYEHFPSGAEDITLTTRDRGKTSYSLRFDGDGELVELRVPESRPVDESRLSDNEYLVDFFVNVGQDYSKQYTSDLSLGHPTDVSYPRRA